MHVPWCLTVAHLPEAVNTCRPLGMFPCGLPRIPTRAIAPDTCAAPSSDFCAVRGSVRERAHLERHAPQRWTVGRGQAGTGTTVPRGPSAKTLSRPCVNDTVVGLRKYKGADTMRRGEPGSESATRAGGQAGIITRLIVQQQPTRVAVFLDGVLSFEVSQDLVQVWGLRVGRRLSGEEQTRLATEEQ